MIIRVFVSSTWLDLIPEREAVEKAIHRIRETKYVGMEYFGSHHETTQRVSLDEIDRSDLYIGIFAERYGSGITEDEYRRSQKLTPTLPSLIYFKEEKTVSDEWFEKDPAKKAKLSDLKKDLTVHTASTFNSPDDLAARVTADLHRWLFDNYLPTRLNDGLAKALSENVRSILADVRHLNELPTNLLNRLKNAGYVTASGERSIAIGGDVKGSNVIAGNYSPTGGDTVQGDKNIYIGNNQAVVVSALHQLPRPSADFVGRESEMKELLAAIQNGGITISGLQGMGGVGKTALALKLADEIKSQYPDGQLFLNLKGDQTDALPVTEALGFVIRTFHPDVKLPDGETELRALYRSVLTDKRALLLMDNAVDASQVEPLIPPKTCLMIVTSRLHFTLDGLTAKNLNELPMDDAQALLLKIAERIGDQAETIAKLCGRLPLALTLAASTLKVKTNLSPSDYARRLGKEEERIKLLDKDSGKTNASLGVEASLSASYDLLTPENRLRWAALSVFPDTFDSKAAADVWEIDGDAATDSLGELISFSLVDYNETTRRYRLHDLGRAFATGRLNANERYEFQKRHARHYDKVFCDVDKLYKQGGDAILRGLALFDLEWGNIQSGQAWSAGNGESDDEAARLCINYPGAGIYVLTLRQPSRDQIKWLETALNAARRLKHRQIEGRILGNLGLAYADLGESHSAIEFCEQALVIDCEMGDRDGEGQALGNLGLAYADLGETRRAIEFQEQWLKIVREIGDKRGEGQALGSLGNAYADLGETHRAIEFYEQDLVIAREIGDRRGEGAILGNLGVVYADLGETRRAIQFYEQQLTITREIGDRRGEGKALGNMSLALDKLGDRKQAIANAEAALQIYEQIEDPNAAKVRNQLAEWRGE